MAASESTGETGSPPAGRSRKAGTGGGHTAKPWPGEYRKAIPVRAAWQGVAREVLSGAGMPHRLLS